jgi:hypothetical protein
MQRCELSQNILMQLTGYLHVEYNPLVIYFQRNCVILGVTIQPRFCFCLAKIGHRRGCPRERYPPTALLIRTIRLNRQKPFLSNYQHNAMQINEH